MSKNSNIRGSERESYLEHVQEGFLEEVGLEPGLVMGCGEDVEVVMAFKAAMSSLMGLVYRVLMIGPRCLS